MSSPKRTRSSNAPSTAIPQANASSLAHHQSVKKRMDELTGNAKFASLFPPLSDVNTSLKELRADLKEVPVRGTDGKVTDTYSKIAAEKTLTKEDKELIWKCLAIVRETFLNLEKAPANPDNLGGYQWNMNWKHTRSEIDQVLEASRLLNLNPSETRDAIIASIFSDSVKNRRNFIVHNVHGAQGAALVLSYYMDPFDPEQLKSIERIWQAALEHQVTPPEFMARAIVIIICKKLGQLPCLPWEPGNSCHLDPLGRLLASIYAKVADPFNKEYLTADCHKIDFTEEERQLLAEIGVDEWYVPHPDNEDSKIAHAVIAGDHSINYNHPEGFAKIALIRGPDTEAIFEDPTVHHSLDSAVSSFADSFRVIRPEVQSLAISGLRRTKTAVERVIAIMRELFNNVVPSDQSQSMSGAKCVADAIARAHERHPELFTVDHGQVSEAGHEYTERAVERVGHILEEWFVKNGSIPYTPKEEQERPEPGSGILPFWNSPLKYPCRDNTGNVTVCHMTELELKQFAFAEKIREIAVELLRAEQWIF
jgi:hypothetical protein